MSEVENQVEQPTEQPAGPSLSLADLLTAVQAIQLAASRGAFKVEEFSEIGGCYERLVGFLETAGAINVNRGDQAPAAE